jgi:surfeit locus 1 family protein
MRLARGEAWPLLAGGLLLALCVALGDWQLRRARDKQALIDAWARGHAAQIDVSARRLDGLPRYQSVSARGTYIAARQILLDNMPSAEDGRPGYRVLTPFRRDATDRLLLVDRGWVPLGSDRTHLPPLDVAEGRREIVGRLDRLPVPGLRLRGTSSMRAARDADWPKVLNFPTAAELAAVLGAPTEPDIVLLDAQTPDGYQRRWQPALRLSPARHLAYAIQWFAFGIVAALALIVTGVRRHRVRAGSGR